MRRIVITLLLVVCIGCASAKPDPAKARAGLQVQAEQMRDATLKRDYEKVTYLAYQPMVNAIGGQAKYIQHLEKMAADTKGQGIEVTDIVLAEPTPIAEGKKAIYSIIPFTKVMKKQDGAKGQRKSFLIAVSGDHGENWTFIDGGGFAGKRANLEKTIPDFPQQLAIPDEQPATWE
jgi:hypothetical protein